MVGMVVLTSAGQAKNDAAATPTPEYKPVMMYRFYMGTDGLSHVEKIEIKFDGHSRSDDIAKLMAISGAEIRRTKAAPPGTVFSGPFHPGSRRQYILNISGHEEVEFSGGEKISLKPGDIELIEDTAPAKGHRNVVVGPEPRVSLWIPLSDQTVVRGPLANDTATQP